MNSLSPLLTISIPTWNRASFLSLTLNELQRQVKEVGQGLVEIIVSDNASLDGTQDVVSLAIHSGMPIRYIRNIENIGSDANIAQCFNLSQGKYVLILGDDDVLIDGTLFLLLSRLKQYDYGVVTLKPYGFDTSFREEYPGGRGGGHTFDNVPEFLAEIGPLMTLISACVINKSLLPDVDARKFCGGNLVQVHLVLQAAFAAKENLFLNKYLVACKRNNSGGYDFSAIFVTSLATVLESYKSLAFTQDAILAIEKTFLIGYYPYYLLRQRLSLSGSLQETKLRFMERFKGRFLFDYWVAPIMFLPRPAAILWGIMVTVVGRVLNGDLLRGISFAVNKLPRVISRNDSIGRS